MKSNELAKEILGLAREISAGSSRGIRSSVHTTVDIMNEILKDAGTKISVRESDLLAKDGKYVQVGNFDVPLKGIYAVIFKRLSCEVKVAYMSEDDIGIVQFSFNWDHKSGSNGVDVRYWIEDGRVSSS